MGNCVFKHFQQFDIAFTPYHHNKLCRENININNIAEQYETLEENHTQ